MANSIAFNIYYPLPKMNPKNLSCLVPLYTTEESSYPFNSVQFFLKDFHERPTFPSPFPPFSKKFYFYSLKKKDIKLPFYSTTPPPLATIQEIEKEWAKLSPLLMQLHLFHNPLYFLSSLPSNETSWNYIHYFSLTLTTNPIDIPPLIPYAYSKYAQPTTGLFLVPHSFYYSNLSPADFILSLYELSEEQIVYLTLFALLVQNPKGAFVLKLKYFYTPLIMDILYLLSCVYNKVILLPLDYVHFYVICKGFQMEFVKPHYTQMRHILYTLRPNALQRIVSKNTPSRRLFSTPLPALFVSKIEEINVLVHHKYLMYLNE
jgi:hypothetical protein